ncbi:helix-turn-helix transcriptional regulator [Streptomyces iconiensis]|uniref:AAA family ATPase n=1 Tax=Streptomyces iconiensis TaxID=1384038 RepID=A0ABT6ZX66_9ACTN|nr:AAA family ATPase [Streptomyces iconiensis]MDJ1133669.1 AAA family ATPase [Streptomyces iconiensis]
MRLVGLDRELRRLNGLLHTCSDGEGGGAAVIGGAMGCGKTELLTALKDQAADQGWRILDAVGSWPERRSPGSVLKQLLCSADALPGAAELLDTVRGACGRVTEERSDGTWTLDAAATDALHQLRAEVVRAAGDVPVLLCVDDVQFADSLSLHWLRRLIRQLRQARIVLVLTECPLWRPAHPELHAELLRQPHHLALTLGTLSPEGVAELLADHLGSTADEGFTERCHQLSGGNPLLIRALLVDSSHLSGQAAPVVGDTFGDMLLSCLHRGRPELLRLTRVLAAVDGDIHAPELLARLAGQEHVAVVRGTRALGAAGFLDGTRLRHPLAAQAVLEGLSVAERSAMHREAALMCYEEGVAVTRTARHLRHCAAEGGALPWAVPVLQEAAERHLNADQVAEAHSCLEAALRFSADDGERVGLRALLTSTAWMLNPSISTPHLGELAIALSDGRLPVRHTLTLAKYLLWHGRFGEAVRAIAQMDEGDGPADPEHAAEVRATWELLSVTYPVVLAPTRKGPAHGDPRTRAALALSQVLAHGPSEGAVAEAEAAMRAMRLNKHNQEWLICAVAALSFADRTEAAARWCDHWLEEARCRQVPLWTAEFASLRAGIALRRGALARARTLAEAALAQVPADSWGVCIGGPLANLIQAATDSGDLAAAAEYLAQPVPDGMFSSRFGLPYLHARGAYHMATGRPYAALDDFTRCGELMTNWGFDQPTLLPWRSSAARAHLALSDVRSARELAREQAELAGEGLSRARGISLRTCAAAGGPGERTGLLEEAAENLRFCGDRFQLAGALGELGHAYALEKRPARARAVQEEAEGLRRACEAVAPAAGHPGAAPDPARTRAGTALDRLSGAERRVVALAAHGRTNKEIAGALTVTVSTVEQHLTNAFRKLGIRSRRELPKKNFLEAATS